LQEYAKEVIMNSVSRYFKVDFIMIELIVLKARKEWLFLKIKRSHKWLLFINSIENLL
jgi:hypothetical protein